MIDVMITDDHPVIREGVKHVLDEKTADIRVVLEAANAAGTLKALKEEMPDILLLDIWMEGKSGLDLLKDIQEFYPGLPVLILSMHPEERFAVRSIKAGASGYLTKGCMADELIGALRTIVSEEKKFISPKVAEQLARQHDGCYEKQLHECFSDREYIILCMIADGKSISQIAEEMSLSIQTVHSYRASLLEKIQVESDVELALYAIRQNLVD